MKKSGGIISGLVGLIGIILMKIPAYGRDIVGVTSKGHIVSANTTTYPYEILGWMLIGLAILIFLLSYYIFKD